MEVKTDDVYFVEQVKKRPRSGLVLFLDGVAIANFSRGGLQLFSVGICQQHLSCAVLEFSNF